MQDSTVNYHRILNREFRLSNTDWNDVPVRDSVAGSPVPLRRSISMSALQLRIDTTGPTRPNSAETARSCEGEPSSRWSDYSSLMPPEPLGPISRLKVELRATVGMLRQVSSYASLRTVSAGGSQTPRPAARRPVSPVLRAEPSFERTPRAAPRHFDEHSNDATLRVRRDSAEGSPITEWFSASESAASSPEQERGPLGWPARDSVALPDDFRSSLLELSSSFDSSSSLGLTVLGHSDGSSSQGTSSSGSPTSWRLPKRLRPSLRRRPRLEARTGPLERGRQPRLSLLPSPAEQESLASAFRRETSSWEPAEGTSYSTIDIFAPVFPAPEPKTSPRAAGTSRLSSDTSWAADAVFVEHNEAPGEESWHMGYASHRLNLIDVTRLQHRLPRSPEAVAWSRYKRRPDAEIMRRKGLYYTGVCASGAESMLAWEVLRQDGLLDRKLRLKQDVEFGQVYGATRGTALKEWKLDQIRGLATYLKLAWQVGHPEAPAGGMVARKAPRPTDYAELAA